MINTISVYDINRMFAASTRIGLSDNEKHRRRRCFSELGSIENRISRPNPELG